MTIIKIFENSNYHTFIKAYINTSYKKNKIFQFFLKKKILSKKKKSQYYRIHTKILSYLRYAHKKKTNFACEKFFLENVCLRTKLNLRLKKPKKCFGAKFLCCHDFCCMELYDKHFRCMEVNPDDFCQGRTACSSDEWHFSTCFNSLVSSKCY